MRRHPVRRAARAVLAAGLAAVAATPPVAAASPARAATPETPAPVTVRLDDPGVVHLYSLFGAEDLDSPQLPAGESPVTLALPDGLDAGLGLPAELAYRVSTRGVEDSGTATRDGALIQVPVAASVQDAALDGGLVTVEVTNGTFGDGVPAEPGQYLRVQETFEFRAAGPQPTPDGPVALADRADAYDVFTFPDSAAPTAVAWGREVAFVLPEGTTWTAGAGAWTDLAPSATLYWGSPASPGEDGMRQEFLSEEDVRVSPDGSTMTVRLPSSPPEGWSANGAPWLAVAAGDDRVPGHSVQANVTLAVSDPGAGPGAGADRASGALIAVAVGGVLLVAGAVVVVLRSARRRRGSAPGE